MTEVAEIESFMERYFGERATDVASDLVEAGLVAHQDSQAAQDGSRLDTNQPYGSTYWLALPKEVVARLLSRLEGAVAYPPRGAQYKLVVWNGLIILPVKVIEGASRDGRLRVRTSHLRANLTSVNMPEAPEATLFDDEDKVLREFEEDAIKAVENARSALGNIASAVVLAAYACTPKGGLQVVEVGIATLDADGFIDFSDSERLSLSAPPVVGTGPVEVAGDRWDEAPKPKPFLEAMEEEQTATGEDEPDDNPDAPVTE